MTQASPDTLALYDDLRSKIAADLFTVLSCADPKTEQELNFEAGALGYVAQITKIIAGTRCLNSGDWTDSVETLQAVEDLCAMLTL